MFMRIFSVVLILSMLMGVLPALAASQRDVLLFSESFQSYAENERNPNSLKIVSGLDARVINDNGNKVFYGRALGESVNFNFAIPSSTSTETVMTIKTKITGGKTSGKLFNATFSGAKVNFINISDDGTLRLYDDTIICGMPQADYKTLTVHAKWKKKVFSVYVDRKCVAKDWAMPSAAATKSPTAIEFIVEYNESSETEFFADDIRVYEGGTLPWKIKSSASIQNTEILEFTPTTDFDPNAVKIIKELNFDGSSTGFMLGNIGTELANSTLEDGTKVMRAYSPEEKGITDGFADLSLPDMASQSKYVFDIKFKVNSMTGSSRFCLLDTKDTAGLWTVRGFEFGAAGTLTADIGGGTTTIPFGEWVRLSFVYNIKKGKIFIYQNGKLAAENTTTAGAYPVYWRFDVISPAGSKMDIYFDWMRIYAGETLLDDSHFTPDAGANVSNADAVNDSKSIMDPTDKLNAALEGKTVFLTTNNSMYYNGKKEIITEESAKLKTINNTLMIPKDTFEKINDGKTLEYNKESGEVSLGDTAVSDIVPVEEEGILYLPLTEAVEKLMNKKLSWDERGMAIIADTKVEVRTKLHYLDRHKVFYDYDLLYRYLLFDNPTGKEIVDEVVKNFPGKAHPRVYWTNEDIDYILDKIETDVEWKNEYIKTINNADNLLYVDMSSYYTVSDSGKQTAASKFQTYIATLATAHLLSGDPKYAKKGVEIMKGFASWSTSGYKTANLTVGHWADGMGIGFDSFYNYMMSSSEGKRDLQYLKERMVELQYEDHIKAYSAGISAGPHWITMQDNFQGVIGGGLMCMILAICDEEDVREQSEYMAENVLKSLYIAAELFYPDGGYYEGVTYGDLMLENFMNGLDALFNCCKTDYGIGRVPGFAKAGDYFVYLNTPTGRLNFHDDGGTYYNRFSPEYMGYRYGELTEAQMGRNSKRLADLKFIINYGLKGLYYYDRAITDKGIEVDVSGEPLDKYFYAIDTGAFRNSHNDSEPTYVGFHAGWTNIPHDMLDLGEFAFISDGVIWAKDLGPDSYSLPGYFAAQGYKIYRKRPEGENCLVLNPQKEPDIYYGQELGVGSTLVDIDMNKPKGAKAAFDLTEAYCRDASKYVRGYYFGDDRNTLTVQDEVTLKGETEVYWFMHTPANIRIVNNNKAILTCNGKTLTVDVYCNIPGFELKQMNAEPLPTSPQVSGQKQNTNYTKLAVYHPKATGDLVISVKLSPSGDYTYTPLEYKPISDWVIPEGEVAQKPKFTGIYADGELIYKFVPGKENYNIELPYGTTKIPVITATSDKGTVEVIQAGSFNEATRVTIKCDGFEDTVCKINYEVSNDRPVKVTKNLTDTVPIVGKPSELITPVKVTGLTDYNANQGAGQAIDGDFNTYYKQDEANDWFEFDLGQVMDISGVAMAFVDGDVNYAAYELMYSEDGTNFVKVFEGLSTGMTKDWETLNIPGRARYIRVVGKGNTQALQSTSITEFRAYK